MSWSAPHPATSSSTLIGVDKGLFFSQYGFSLNAKSANWKLVEKGPPESLNEARFRPKDELSEASLAVRVDLLKEPNTLEQYAKKWIRDYAGYGFTVLGNKTFSHSGYHGYVVDLVHNTKQKQVRQVLYVKGRQAVILTCSDDKKSFNSNLKSCNEIARSFEWTQQ